MTPPTNTPEPVRLMLFDVNSRGHHAGYIEHVLRAWRQSGAEGRLVAVVSPLLLDAFPAVRALEGPTERGSVELVVMPGAPAIEAQAGLFRKGLGERRLLKRYADALRPEAVVGLYGDHTQFVLASRVRLPPGTRVSLLFLRVSHHRRSTREPRWTAVTRCRKVAVLRAAFRHPQMGTAFSADPTALDAIASLVPHARTCYLPDPVPLPVPEPDLARIRARYGVEPGRTLLLLFGALARRKGVLHTLDALPKLSPEVARTLTVLFAGPVETDLAPILTGRIEAARARTRAQILLHDAFLDEPEMSALMQATDLVLLPYQLHAGTSSVLIRAAGAGRPVLTQTFGLMAEQTAHHRLGQTVDTARPEAIAAGIMAYVQNPALGFDPATARAFAESHTPEAYGHALLDGLGLLDRAPSS